MSNTEIQIILQFSLSLASQILFFKSQRKHDISCKHKYLRSENCQPKYQKLITSLHLLIRLATIS